MFHTDRLLMAGLKRLVCNAGTELLSSSRGKSAPGICPVCCENVKSDIRSHMGCHILQAIRGVPDTVVNPISSHLPCGFCGRCGEADCTLTMKILSRSIQWSMQCPRMEPFQYGSANKGSDNRPCRNVPVICTLCHHPGKETDAQPAIWHYNMEAHLTDRHPQYAHPGKADGLPLPEDVYEATAVTALEESKFSIPTRMAFTKIQQKENVQPAGVHALKRRSDTHPSTSSAATTHAKRGRHSH